MMYPKSTIDFHTSSKIKKLRLKREEERGNSPFFSGKFPGISFPCGYRHSNPPTTKWKDKPPWSGLFSQGPLGEDPPKCPGGPPPRPNPLPERRYRMIGS